MWTLWQHLWMEKWKEHLKSDNLLQRYRAKQFIKTIEKSEPINEFDVDLFLKLIEKMTVFKGKKITVSLLDGTGIECEIE